MKTKPIFFFVWLLLIVIALNLPSHAQLVIGQYKNEAPLRTWNNFGILNGVSTGLGGILFSTAKDCSTALSNPALLNRLPKINISANYSFSAARLYKYGLINTGALFSSDKASVGVHSFDFAGISYRLKNWAVCLNYSILESYRRPDAAYEYSSREIPYYSLDFSQKGHLNNLNLSIAKNIFDFLSIGIGCNYAFGTLNREMNENWYYSDIYITDKKNHNFKAFFINGGISLDVTEKLGLSAVFRTPFVKKSDSQSTLHYYSPSGDTDIKIEATSESQYKQPFIAGFGLFYQFSDKFKAASEISFFNWSTYSVDFFGEQLDREFRDIVTIKVGVEYMFSEIILKEKANIPVRAGIIYDPQPMNKIRSNYYYLSVGIGYHWKFIHFDLGTLLGMEKGSGDSLLASRIAFSTSLFL